MSGLLRRGTAGLAVAVALAASAVAPAAAAGGVSRVERAPEAGATVHLDTRERADTALYTLRLDSQVSVRTYRAVATTDASVDPRAAYVETAWKRADETLPDPDAGAVAWIVRNSFPDIDLERLRSRSGVRGLSTRQAIAGTQAAIWHYTSDVSLNGRPRDGGGNKPGVQALYDYLVDGARDHDSAGPAPSLAITPDQVERADPDQPIGPLTVRSADGGPVRVTVRGSGAPKLTDADGAPVTEVSAGTEVFVRVSAAAPAGVATVHARTDNAIVPSGGLFVGKDGVQTQPLVAAEAVTTSSTASAKVDWSAPDAGAEPAPAPPERSARPDPDSTVRTTPATPSASPSPDRVDAGDERPPDDSGLAWTGTWAGAIAAIALVLLGSGAALTYLGRRRRDREF